MAAKWWDALTPEEQIEWLDSAEADGRERFMLATFTLMGDGENLVGVRDGIDFDEGR
jgi:hypothetical protein